MPNSISLAELVGQRFGSLTVIEEGPRLTETKRRSKRAMVCLCDCGRTKTIPMDYLRSGVVKGCGCKQHNGSKGSPRMSPERIIHTHVIARCYYPSCPEYHNYGGRGIAVYEPWRKFDRFITDVGERPSPEHTIERIDNEKGYFPGNVRWALRSEQNRNTRRNRWLTLGDKRMCLKDWAVELGVHETSILYRLDKKGLTEEEALSLPFLNRGRPRKPHPNMSQDEQG